MKPKLYKSIEEATITLLKKGGQGILVKNKMILTASHCVSYDLSGRMALGGYYSERLETNSGYCIAVPIFIEPVSDIAVLGPVDDQELFNEYKLFNDFCSITTPVKICREKLEVGKKFRIFIFTHKKEWITGSAKLVLPDCPMLWIEVDEQIKGGTSGSAVVNEDGQIVGIVSTCSFNGPCDGNIPRPLLSLPVWICRRI